MLPGCDNHACNLVTTLWLPSDNLVTTLSQPFLCIWGSLRLALNYCTCGCWDFVVCVHVWNLLFYRFFRLFPPPVKSATPPTMFNRPSSSGLSSSRPLTLVWGAWSLRGGQGTTTSLLQSPIKCFIVAQSLPLCCVWWDARSGKASFSKMWTSKVHGRVCGALVQFGCYQHRHEWMWRPPSIFLYLGARVIYMSYS